LELRVSPGSFDESRPHVRRWDWAGFLSRAIPGAERLVDFEIEEVIDNAERFPLLTRFRQPSRFNPKSEPSLRLAFR